MKERYQKKSSRSLCRYAAVCAAFLLFFVMGFDSFAARIGNVRVNDVNVRSEASADSGRVCKLPINTEVAIVEEATGSDGNVWYSVTFTQDGSQKSGWIRSDMLNVSEVEDPQEEGGEAAAYTIQEPAEEYVAGEGLTKTSIQVGENSFTAWQVDSERTGGRELYLVAAAAPDGGSGWFYYDPADGTFQREMGQFASADSDDAPEGLIEALQKELTSLKESSAKALQLRLYLIVGLGVLCFFLLILTIVFAVKYHGAAYEYYDEDEDDEDEDSEDEDDEDDFYEDEEADEAVDMLLSLTEEAEDEDELPEIDMSAILELTEEEEKKASQKPEAKETEEEKEPEEDGLEDFDIEILDWDDLGL